MPHARADFADVFEMRPLKIARDQALADPYAEQEREMEQINAESRERETIESRYGVDFEGWESMARL